MKKIVLTIAIFTSIISFSTYGQIGEVEEKTIIIVKERPLDLPFANRNYEKITFTPPQPEAKPQEYVYNDVPLILPKLTTNIKVLRLSPEPLPKLYGHYVKGGLGNYGTTYLEGFFNNKRSEKSLVGIHIKHLASQNGPVKYSGTSENFARVYGKYFGKSTVFNGGLGYERDKYNYYGFNQSLEVDQDTIKQIYSTFNVNAGLESLNKDDKFTYGANFNYYNFQSRTDVKESEFLTDIKAGYKISNDKIFLLSSALSFSGYTNDSNKVNRSYFILKPAVKLNFDKLNLTAGLNAAYGGDTINGMNKFHLYPVVAAEYIVLEDKLVAFGGIDGELQKVTFRNLVKENPFLGNSVALSHTNKALEVYAGIKGNALEKLNYKVALSYNNYKNLYFFANSVEDTSRFSALYDKNTTVVIFNADAGYVFSEAFRVNLSTGVFNYNLSLLDEPWHRPGFTTSVLASYNLHRKIYINSDIYYISGLKAKNFTSNELKSLPSIFDLNVRAEYKFSEVFSAFLDFNNILSKKYQRYLYYPVKGINIIGGVSYSF
ncbi:MAG TPA: hypothetical protein VIK89_06890 [Cytophagaceae bacterium]